MVLTVNNKSETPRNGENIRDNQGEPPQKRIKITASNGWRVLHEMKYGQLDKLNRTGFSSSRRAKFRGKIGFVFYLPLDVLFELLGHLHPLDLLHLTRITKEFRRLLLHKSTVTIWKAAFANMPKLPECPAEMSLPAWANLVFDQYCHNCGFFNAKNVVDFILRTRLCRPCTKICLVSSKFFDGKAQKDKLILRCVPFSKWNNGSAKFCLIDNRDDFLKKLVNPNCTRQEFVDTARSKMKARIEHGERCHAWLKEETEEQEKELNIIRLARKNAIVDKLAQIGYREELDYLSDLEHDVVHAGVQPGITLFAKHLSVRIAKPLTNQIWSSIRGKMIIYMDQVRAHIAQEERLKLLETRKVIAIQAWREYRQNHFTDFFMPSPLDVLEVHNVREIIELPSSQEATMAMFNEVLDENMPDFLKGFRWEEADSLASRHPCDWPRYSVALYGTTGIHKLDLAVCVFTCTNQFLHKISTDPEIGENLFESYEQPLFHPEFLHHPCNSVCRKQMYYDKADREIQIMDENKELSVDYQFSDCRRDKWSSEKLVPHEKASRAVQKILEACGLDPRSATVKGMDKLDPRLICLKCTFGGKADGDRRCSVWTWRNAVKHCLKVHFGGAVAWQKISEEDASVARSLEPMEPARRSLPPPKERLLRCLLCLDGPRDRGRMSMEELRDHFSGVHYHTGALVRGSHYNVALEAPPIQPMTVKMVPKAVL
ncbi:hypothetical protein D9615_000956 [Tricholomella constricta]|uniref:F-box domain-containing protein n=1 Tax=Tricholomella constricta TaxID=117010 RepID=A0A8H5HKA9_9AGAR|nr:hypothetical protein D9615_000956 [Tricholomella constricta]